MRINDFMLTEAPIQDFNLIGDWSRNSSFRDPNDRKLLQNPKAVAKIKSKWENTPFDFSMWFANSPEANRYSEIGMVTTEWMQAKMPQTLEQMTIDENAINVVFTNNKGAQRVPMTAWIIAHRFGHAVSRYDGGERHVPEFTDARNAFLGITKDILSDYGHNNIPNNERDYAGLDANDTLITRLWEQICTFRSAREGNIRNNFEIILEMFAQYITTGRVRFNPLPESFRYGRSWARFRSSSTDENQMNQYLQNFANDLDYYFEGILHRCVGKLFVM